MTNTHGSGAEPLPPVVEKEGDESVEFCVIYFASVIFYIFSCCCHKVTA